MTQIVFHENNSTENMCDKNSCQNNIFDKKSWLKVLMKECCKNGD